MKHLHAGHIVSATEVSTNLDKIVAIKDRLPLRNLKELQTFLGTVSNYRQYIRNFAANARPVNQLTAKGANWN